MKNCSKTATFFLNAFWRALYPLNFFLILLLAFQSVIFTLVAFFEEFSVPQFAVRAIKEEAVKNGLELEFSSAKIMLNGEIIVEDPTLRFVGTPEEFFKADKMSVSFWIMRLLAGGDLRLKNVRIIDGRLGTTYGDIDTKPTIHGIYANIKKRGAWWYVSPLRFRFGKLGVHAEGVINESFKISDILDLSALSNSMADAAKSANLSISEEDDTDKNAPEYVKISAKLDKALSDYPKIDGYLKAFDNPLLRAEFALFGMGENYIGITFESSGVSFKTGKTEIEAADFGCNFKIRSSIGREDRISASAHIDGLSATDLPSFKSVRVRTDAVFQGDAYALRNFDVSAEDVLYDGIEIESVSMRKRDVDKSNWKRDWYAFASSGFQRMGGTISIDDGNILHTSFSGTLNPKIVMMRKEFEKISELKDFSFPTGVNVAGDFAFNFETRQPDARIDFEVSDCVIMKIPAVSASGRVVYDHVSGVLSAENLRVESFAGWSLNGLFTQNLKDLSYRIRVNGTIKPMDIAHFMEPWWRKIMKNFSFADTTRLPTTDVSVEGKWGDPENIWCFARVSGVNVIYEGVPFDSFGMFVWVNPHRITLYDATFTSGRGRAHASLEWLYGDDGLTSYQKQEIFLVSTLAPAALAALGGEDAKEVLDIVRFEEAPNLTLNAVLYNPHEKDRPLDVFNASVFARGNTRVDKAVLKNARFSARSDTIHTVIEDASFQFCAGHATGSLKLQKTDAGMLFDGDVFASKMNQGEFAEFLSRLDEDESDTAAKESSGSSFMEGGTSGIVDLSIALKGNIDKIEELSGSGFVQIENKDLIQLNLFGMLSRTLSSIGIPLASFDITYASSPFKIGDGSVTFGKLEMGGPVMQIKGAANYNFVKDNVNARFIVIPFGGMTFPVISTVMSLFNPLASVVSITLSGSLSDPSIGAQLTPSKILKSDERILNDIINSF